MILKELNAYYGRLLEDPEKDVPERFWSMEKAAWELEIDGSGALVSVLPLTGGEEKNARQFIPMQVPEHDTRTSGKKPFFLCDNAAYLLGLDEKDGAEKLLLSSELHGELLAHLDDPAAHAVCAFFDNVEENLGSLSDARKEELAKGGFAVFRLKGDASRVHERPAVRQAWQDHCNRRHQEGDTEGQCSVTGRWAQMAASFPQVTGIPGAQSAGASLVSFNKGSFESYGKKKTGNAALSKGVAFNAGTALRHLFNDPDHKVRLGDTTVLFWADRPASGVEEFVSLMLGGAKPQSAESKTAAERVSQFLHDVKKGVPIEGCDPEARFFLLGISPNAARLSVRFFEVSTFGALMEHYREYLNDTEMVDVKPISLFGLLKQTAPLGDAKAIPSTLVNACMHAMLTGGRFPRSLMLSLLSRMRADHASGNGRDMGQRAALMKACIKRNRRLKEKCGQAGSQGREITVTLDRESKEKAYLLGRYFAILERAQTGAQGDLNATIRDRYFGAALATPARVFPALMAKSANHYAKLRKDNPGLCRMLEKETDEIFKDGGFGIGFPKTLGVDEQGSFCIGYHQQRADLWTSKKSENTVAAGTEK